MTDKVLPRMRSDDEVDEPKAKAPAKEKAPSIYVTGHCAVGNCFKTKNTTANGGRLLPSCQWKYEYRGNMIICTHECHSEYAEMIKLIEEMAADTGSDSSFMMSGELREAATYVARIDDRRLYEPLLTVPLVGEPREFGPTPTGRAARGELEDNVRKAIIKVYGFEELTIQTVAILVNREDPPSVGAVHAVLTRWQERGLAELAQKPLRFVKFTPLGEQHLMR